MRVVHTADWHLGDKLGTVDRTDEIFDAVECVLDICDRVHADTLLVAGDVFENYRSESFSDLVCSLAERLSPYLHKGLRTVFIPGNHDREHFFRLLHAVQAISSREAARNIHFVSGPRILMLPDPSGEYGVQFVLAPYPTVERYLPRDAGSRALSLEERRHLLAAAFRDRLALAQAELDPRLPGALVAHVYVRTAETSSLLRMSETEDIPVEPQDIPPWAYVALGHIHKPQEVNGRRYVRYSGSIVRVDAAEGGDDKSCVLVHIGPSGLLEDPELLPLPARPIHIVEATDTDDIGELAERYPDRDRALVNLRLNWHAELGGPAAVLVRLRHIFPHIYKVDARQVGESSVVHRIDVDPTDFVGTVRAFLRSQLEEGPYAERLLAKASDLAIEVRDASAAT